MDDLARFRRTILGVR